MSDLARIWRPDEETYRQENIGNVHADENRSSNHGEIDRVYRSRDRISKSASLDRDGGIYMTIRRATASRYGE